MTTRLLNYKARVEKDMIDKRDNHGWTNPLLLGLKFEAKMQACDDLIAEVSKRLPKKKSSQVPLA